MSTALPSMRIVRDEAGFAESPVRLTESVESTEQVLDRVEALQTQLSAALAELEGHRRRDERIHHEMHRLDEELRLAARIQRDFLPKDLPEVGRVRFHTLFRPAGYVSGDIYDVVRLDEHHVGFSIADAVGHGMPAALLTMFIKRALVTKEILKTGYRLLMPSEAMAHLNQALIDQHLSQATFATAMYGTIDVRNYNVQFACGGHPSPLLLKRDGTLEAIESSGGLLGIFDGEVFTDHSVQLQAGDRLFIYSDGMEIAFSNDPTPDSTIWREQIQKRGHLPTAELLSDLTAHLDSQDGSLMPKDDLTLVVLEIR